MRTGRVIYIFASIEKERKRERQPFASLREVGFPRAESVPPEIKYDTDPDETRIRTTTANETSARNARGLFSLMIALGRETAGSSGHARRDYGPR